MSFKNCCVVLWVFVLYILGAWLFFSGFLLKRHVISEYSSKPLNVAFNITCHDFSTLQSVSFRLANQIKGSYKNVENTDENKLKRFERAVVIIIDALRYDFALFSNETAGVHEQYSNNMVIFKELLNNYPRHSSLIKLVADAPTTTLQRLKAITTGSLPTFIDISLNFASGEIAEDNLVYQARRTKEIVFMGDDTWDGLFPDHFKRSFPYPSFNVKDLDTVDYGILDHIYSELKKNDWSILIAHFLGVDHCGHRYGPRHPEMKRKLSEMDDMLRKIIPLLKEDTILFVLGDHGMTESGDHGGDSSDEISTVLFVYSPSCILPEKPDEELKKAAQVDFVPTLALLLGLPIPFSNLGSVIPDFFSLQSHNHSILCFHEELDLLLGGTLALAENSVQVHRFLLVYTNISTDLPENIIKNSEMMLDALSSLWLNITEDVNQSKEVLRQLFVGYRNYLSYVRNECERIWATFDSDKMSLGLLVLCSALCFNLIFASGFSLDITSFVLLNLFIVLSIAVVLTHGYVNLLFCVLSVCLIVYCKNFVKRLLFGVYLSVDSTVCLAFSIMVLLFMCSFSNSFVVYEDGVVLTILQTALVYKYFPVVQNFLSSVMAFGNKAKRSRRVNQKIVVVKVFPFLLLLLGLAGIRLSILFHKCREEQNCESSSFLISLENLNDGVSNFYKKLRLIISLSSVISPVVTGVLFIRYKLSVYSYSSVMSLCNHLRITYGIPFICMCICFHWLLSMAPHHVLQKILKKNQTVLSHSALVVSGIVFFTVWLFPLLSENPRSMSSNQVHYTSLSLLFFSMLLPSYIIAGDGLAPAITIMAALIVLVPALNHFSSRTALNKSESKMWLDAVVWGLLSCNWFYGTGHQAAFPSIQWQAAFVLNPTEVVSYVLSGALVLFNTFSAQVLHGIALPFLLTYKQPMQDFDACLIRLILKYLSFHGIKFLGASAACWTLRRHLMVWKIFSPKLVFEAVSLVVTMISVTLSYFFMLRTASCYHFFLRSKTDSSYLFKEK